MAETWRRTPAVMSIIPDGTERDQGSADPDRPGYGGTVLPDPAVPVVPVARVDRHADPPGDCGVNCGVHCNQLLQGPAGRGGGGDTGGRHDNLAGVPLYRHAAGAPGIMAARILALIFSWKDFIPGAALAG